MDSSSTLWKPAKTARICGLNRFQRRSGGLWTPRPPQYKNIRLLFDAPIHWINLIPNFSIHHVRREQNKEADKLANLAMDGRRNSVKWENKL